MRLFVFVAALYLIAPGHPDVLLAGLPVGQTGTVLLVLLVGAWAWTRDVACQAPKPLLTGLVATAIAVKVVIAALAPPSGWSASYYANDQFTPPVQPSLDFPGLAATRIDRQLSFTDTEFPVHFFNYHGFNFGFRREVTEPFSVHWRGYLQSTEPTTITVESRGPVDIDVDGTRAAILPITIEAGTHIVDVRHRKPRDTDGLLRVLPVDAGGTPREWRRGEVTPAPVSVGRRALTRWLVVPAWLLHACVLGIVLRGVAPAVAAKATTSWRRTVANPLDGLHHWVAPVVLVLLTAQGLWKSRHLVDHVWTLTGGDDWWAFEVNARDVLVNGWLMNEGGLSTTPFFVYPGYGYFVAGVHAVTGESLAGVILVNFVALAVATILVYAMARMIVTPLAAYVAVAWLLILEQLDFVRYYTVTLLSENLFLLLVAATLYLFVRFANRGGWRWLAGAAWCGGLATGTRPTMLLYLPLAMVLAAVVAMKRDGWRRAAGAGLLVASLWTLGLSPFTLRNYLVAGTPVLVTSGQGLTFLHYNMPPGTPEENRKYLVSFTGTNVSALKTLLWILWDHPVATLRQWGVKIGFSLGMVHWMGMAPHPEFVITSLLYLAAIVFVRRGRTTSALIVHAFIATHLATLLLTAPSNYGYRMLLAMFLFMPVFAGALLAGPLEAWLRRRRPSWVVSQA